MVLHQSLRQVTAFEGSKKLVAGELEDVTRVVRVALAEGRGLPVLVFDDETGEQVDLDFGSPERALAQPDNAVRGPGRPRLGVVAREVTLLPRHWEWLAAQPGGASVALRKLVDVARRTHAAADRKRAARDAAHRFLSAIAGNAPGFEEALRALYAEDRPRFEHETRAWPPDVRNHAMAFAIRSFASEEPTET